MQSDHDPLAAKAAPSKPVARSKFVWNGWRDPYDSCTVATLLNDKGKIIWQGRHYYSGELRENLTEARSALQAAAEKFKVTGYDFSSNDVSSWGLEDKRTWSDMG